MTKEEIRALGNEELIQLFSRSRTKLASEHPSMPHTLQSRDRKHEHIERDARIGGDAQDELLCRLREREVFITGKLTIQGIIIPLGETRYMECLEWLIWLKRGGQAFGRIDLHFSFIRLNWGANFIGEEPIPKTFPEGSCGEVVAAVETFIQEKDLQVIDPCRE